MEPKILYRAAVEQVPVDAYYLPLDKAEVLKTGKDLTIVSYGTPLYTCSAAIAAAERDFGCRVELIDLRTIYPWDRDTVLESVKKTGRAIVVHESMMNAGVGAEVAATIQERAFLRLEAPVKRVTGWATHTGLMFEQFIIPDVTSKYFTPFGPCIQSCADFNRGVRRDQEDDRILNATRSQHLWAVPPPVMFSSFRLDVFAFLIRAFLFQPRDWRLPPYMAAFFIRRSFSLAHACSLQ
jgi:hypothetical protein